MRRALWLLPFFVISPASAAEITSRITDSVQLTVDGPTLQSTRIGSSYSVSGTNVSVTTMGCWADFKRCSSCCIVLSISCCCLSCCSSCWIRSASVAAPASMERVAVETATDRTSPFLNIVIPRIPQLSRLKLLEI